MSKEKTQILIAEDSPNQAAQLAHLLEQHGFLATIADNGREALCAMADCVTYRTDRHSKKANIGYFRQEAARICEQSQF